MSAVAIDEQVGLRLHESRGDKRAGNGVEGLTYQPSGRYRLTTSGIFFSRSSLMAIWRGSVSPSRSTRTGAFMLQVDILGI